MNTSLSNDRLNLPEALMVFLHNDDGQVYQSVSPKRLVAAAELGELMLSQLVDVAEDHTIHATAHPEPGERAWVAGVLEGLAKKPVKADAWIRGRYDAVKVQQEAAVERGALTTDRAKLAGVISYRRHLAAPDTRAELLAELAAPEALESPRLRALAKLLTTPAMRRVTRLDDELEAKLESLAETSQGTPLPGPLFSTMDYAIAVGVAVAVFGD